MEVRIMHGHPFHGPERPVPPGRRRGPRRPGPGGPGGPGRRRAGGGPWQRTRVSRGEVRSAILRLLAEQPMHGYQVMQELEDRSGGGWQPSPGSIYPTLQQLSDEGLIISEAQDGKNVFSLTAAGQEALEQLDEPPAWERFSGDDMANLVDLRRGLFQLGQAVKQISASGNKRQVEQANVVLKDARKALYRLLAEDEE